MLAIAVVFLLYITTEFVQAKGKYRQSEMTIRKIDRENTGEKLQQRKID